MTLPAGAWRRWSVTLALGWTAALAVTAATVEVARRLDLQTWDRELLVRLGEHGPMSFVHGILFESFANLVYLGPLTLLVAIVAARWRLPLEAATMLAVYVLQRPLVLIGRQLWPRERPDLILGGIASPGAGAFPSGHAALSLSAYGFLAYLWIRSSASPVERTLAVLLTASLLAVIGLARLALGAHWPSDLVGGWIVGAVWLAAAIIALERAR